MKKMLPICILFLLPIFLFAGDYTFIGTTNASADLISSTLTAGSSIDISGLTVNQYNGFTPTSGTTTTVISTNGGTYFVKYSISFSATGSCDWTIAVDVNGTTKYHEITRRMGSSGDVGNASGSGLLVLSVGDAVKLTASPSANQDDFIPVDVQLVLVEVKENTSSPEYASMTINSTVSAFSVGTTYTTFTGLSSSAVSTNWSAASGVLTCNSADAAGEYLAIFSFSGDANNEVLTDIGIAVGSNDPSAILTQRTFGKTADIGNVSGCGIISIANGNTVSLKGKGADPKNFDIHFANVTLVKIEDSQNAPYASMNITSETGAFTVGTAWTKVTSGLANDITDGTFWSFSDNSLTPVGVSGGYYLVNYYYSLTGAGGDLSSTIIVDGVIGINNTAQLDLAVKRKLDKKDGADIGAAAGTGIIYIDEAADDITMLLQAPGGASDMQVRKANLSIIRIDKNAQDQSLPVDLTSFTTTQKNNTVILEWQTASETNNHGFIMDRKYNDNEFIELASYLNNKELKGAGSKSASSDYKFIDKNILSAGTYEYRISSVDYTGKVEILKSKSIDIETEHSTDIPNTYALKQAFPNPFNPTTTISYNLPKSSFVKISIFDINGNILENLINENKNAGFYTIQWNASQFSSGIYFYRMTTGNFVSTKKIILIR